MGNPFKNFKNRWKGSTNYKIFVGNAAATALVTALPPYGFFTGIIIIVGVALCGYHYGMFKRVDQSKIEGEEV